MDKRKLALIHIIKKELDLSDQEYRDILYRAVGVRTAKDLTEGTFRKLMNYFVRSKHYRINELGLTIRQKVYIDYLVRKLKWDQAHLNNFIHKYYHKPTVDTLTRKEAIKLIESLKNVQLHRK